MPRKKFNQTHDRKVRQLAGGLKKKGYNVQADISGYDTPEKIGKSNYTPDIIANRGNEKKIIEVDTPGTEDPKQLSSFRRSAGQSDNVEFEHVITKPRKKKR